MTYKEGHCALPKVIPACPESVTTDTFKIPDALIYNQLAGINLTLIVMFQCSLQFHITFSLGIIQTGTQDALTGNNGQTPDLKDSSRFYF